MEETIAEVHTIHDMVLNDKEQLSNNQIQSLIMPNISELCINNSFLNVILELRKKDHYTYRHCVGVAVISFLLGKWLGLKEAELRDLAIAGLMHDIGKIKIPDSILNKASRLSADEYAVMKLHTHFGYEMIRHLPEMTEQQALVALQHHEREDGSGYPFGISGEDIAPFSKIVAVADVFHTMISERVYKKPAPLYQVYREIYQRASGLFDPLVVQSFISNVMNRMIGNSVLLSNGQIARITMLHPDDLINPLVVVQGQYYDLRQSDIYIVDFIPNLRKPNRKDLDLR
jgi:HD-GYP domain